jgi:hypothetical protein
MSERLTIVAKEGVTLYHGNLKLPPDASPDDHIRVRKAFLDRLKYHRKRLGCVIELFAYMHIDDQLNAHYDFMLYTDMSERKVTELVRTLWLESGGRERASVVKVKDGQAIVPLARYMAKADKVKESKRRYRRLPIGRADGGIKVTWGTSGFWGEESFRQYGDRLAREYGERFRREECCPLINKTQSEKSSIPSSSTSTPSTDVLPPLIHDVAPLTDDPARSRGAGLCGTSADSGEGGIDPGFAGEAEERVRRFLYELPKEPLEALGRWRKVARSHGVDMAQAEGIVRKRIAYQIVRSLPTSREESVGIGEYSEQWGLPVGYVAGIVSSFYGVNHVDGELINGTYVFNGLCRDEVYWPLDIDESNTAIQRGRKIERWIAGPFPPSEAP